jgi:hypothetical protein
MRTVHLYKAQALTDRGLPPESVSILIEKEFPDLVFGMAPDDTWIKVHRREFDHQAETLVDTLIDTLPGGTIDAIIVRLLDYKRSLLVVNEKQRGER